MAHMSPTTPFWLEGIQRPCLLLDERRLQANIQNMLDRSRGWQRPLRPHVKTHQSPALAARFREAGVQGITVSSLDMARLFLEAGWSDQTLALPLNPTWLPSLAELNTHASIAALVADPGVLQDLHGLPTSARIPLWVEVDTGHGRSGIPWNQPEELVALVRELRRMPACRFKGLLTHAGDSYAARGPVQVQAVASRVGERMLNCRAALEAAGIGPVALSFGDTPCCQLASGLEVYDELRPGNFVFHDLMQLQIGACGEEGLALAVLCPVLNVRPDLGQAVLHGGAVHLSREAIRIAETDATGQRDEPRDCFGQVVALTARGLGERMADTCVTRISQEHGMLSAPASFLKDLRPGHVLAILPAHSCLAADLHREYRLPDGSRIEKSCCL